MAKLGIIYYMYIAAKGREHTFFKKLETTMENFLPKGNIDCRLYGQT